jgi:hypothetical protein
LIDEKTRKLRRAFRYLKQGVFPPDSIAQLTFGRSAELKLIRAHLNDVGSGSSRHVFVEGTYGQGKSHVLKALEAIALERNFAVSWLVLDGHNHAFNHPSRYFHSALENLRAPSNSRQGLATIVARWLRGPERDSVIAWSEGSSSSLAWSVRSLRRLLAGDSHVIRDVGYHLESRDIAAKNGRVHFGLVSQRIQDVASLVRAAGLSGLVFLFDELETVATLLFGIRQRFLSYEFLNFLVDARRHPYCLFAFAVTPDFGSRLLTDRVDTNYYAGEYSGACRFVQKWHDTALDVVRLRKLKRADLLELCGCLRDFHADAFGDAGCRRFSDRVLSHFVDSAQRRNLDVRQVVRSLVHCLEVAEQHRDIDVAGALLES